LSMPLGPSEVLMASATDRAAIMLAVRTAVGFSLSLKALLPALVAPCAMLYSVMWFATGK
jgi:hypothetical protein